MLLVLLHRFALNFLLRFDGLATCDRSHLTYGLSRLFLVSFSLLTIIFPNPSPPSTNKSNPSHDSFTLSTQASFFPSPPKSVHLSHSYHSFFYHNPPYSYLFLFVTAKSNVNFADSHTTNHSLNLATYELSFPKLTYLTLS